MFSVSFPWPKSLEIFDIMLISKNMTYYRIVEFSWWWWRGTFSCFVRFFWVILCGVEMFRFFEMIINRLDITESWSISQICIIYVNEIEFPQKLLLVQVLLHKL